MHEYDEKVRRVLPPYEHGLTVSHPQFVIPRINPIRKDAAVMTHQAEMVNVWV